MLAQGVAAPMPSYNVVFPVTVPCPMPYRGAWASNLHNVVSTWITLLITHLVQLMRLNSMMHTLLQNCLLLLCYHQHSRKELQRQHDPHHDVT